MYFEIAAKYPAGASIANVPSTSSALLGRRLEGSYYLEVPVQTGPIPQRVLDAAKRADVKIRDINGKVY
jgi:filamentous hemagglutinin